MMFVLFFILAFMNVPIAFTLGIAAIVPLIITEEFSISSCNNGYDAVHRLFFRLWRFLSLFLPVI